MSRVHALHAAAQIGALYHRDQQAALSERCGHRPASTEAISVAASEPAAATPWESLGPFVLVSETSCLLKILFFIPLAFHTFIQLY